jgi:hypothetical protein
MLLLLTKKTGNTDIIINGLLLNGEMRSALLAVA